MLSIRKLKRSIVTNLLRWMGHIFTSIALLTFGTFISSIALGFPEFLQVGIIFLLLGFFLAIIDTCNDLIGGDTS